ncbi:hypothetical protein HDE_05120 [Halotydeus destructor]|nr:hypothetical protein HDE_05120 [Halotydeus destructor]
MTKVISIQLEDYEVLFEPYDDAVASEDSSHSAKCSSEPSNDKVTVTQEYLEAISLDRKSNQPGDNDENNNDVNEPKANHKDNCDSFENQITLSCEAHKNEASAEIDDVLPELERPPRKRPRLSVYPSDKNGHIKLVLKADNKISEPCVTMLNADKTKFRVEFTA